MRIVMVGAGYVGLVSGACLSEFGHEVVCIDNDPARIRALEAGVIPIYEPGLDEVVAANMRAGRLLVPQRSGRSGAQRRSGLHRGGYAAARRGDGHADLSYVFQAAKEIAANLNGYTVVVTKSTVPVGTRQGEVRVTRSARRGPMRISMSLPIRNSCAKARRSRISAVPTRGGGGLRQRARPRGDAAKSTARLFLSETPMLFAGREAPS